MVTFLDIDQSFRADFSNVVYHDMTWNRQSIIYIAYSTVYQNKQYTISCLGLSWDPIGVILGPRVKETASKIHVVETGKS